MHLLPDVLHLFRIEQVLLLQEFLIQQFVNHPSQITTEPFQKWNFKALFLTGENFRWQQIATSIFENALAFVAVDFVL